MMSMYNKNKEQKENLTSPVVSKPKVALYWAASCGGCECTIVDIGAAVLDIAEKVEFVLWPVALDFKYHHIEAMQDNEIDLCLFNGAIRTSEQEYFAKLLRAKSKVLVAFGACAYMGGIPGMADFTTKEKILQTAYKDLNTVQGETVVPKTKVSIKEGELHIPEIYSSVYRLSDTVDVDYFVPGCPPTSADVVAFLTAVLEGNLPPVGSVFGKGKNLCDECEREKKDKKIKRFYRPTEKQPNPDECLLDQGFLCMGPATRAGCGTLCIKANMACRGCYGPAGIAEDQGVAFLSALSSIIDSNSKEETKEILGQIPDLNGLLYRFGLSAAKLKDKDISKEGGNHE